MRATLSRKAPLRSTCGLLALMTAAAPALAEKAEPKDHANAERAYKDIMSRFWIGSAATGHPAVTTYDGTANPAAATEVKPQKGWFWEYGMEIQLIWADWKVTGSADAKQRLAASWRWTRSIWSDADLAKCGVGTTSTALDDSTWGAAALYDMYEATHDPEALADTKALLDCAWDRWRDDGLGGSMWYNDAHAEKDSYQASYAVTAYDYYRASHDKAYFERAKALTDWAEATLKRSDGIYWEGIDPKGVPMGQKRPDDIREAGSVSFLEGNMAWAVMNARLYRDTHKDAYRDSAISTAQGIAKHELVMPGDELLNDRDAFVDGWAAYAYAKEVVPLLPEHGAVASRTYLDTARSIMQRARGEDGTYSGSWSGPFNGVWAQGRSKSYVLMVSVNTAMWPIVASMF